MASRVGWDAPAPEKLVYVAENGKIDPFGPEARSGFVCLAGLVFPVYPAEPVPLSTSSWSYLFR